MGIAEIKKTASPSFYDGLETWKKYKWIRQVCHLNQLIHVDLHLLQTLVLCNW
jgi:hypothetical protein